jgi:hypothetical protein
MRSLRRANRLLLTMAGPATFEVPWKRDVRYVISLFEEDQATGQIQALSSVTVTSITATARVRPYASDFVHSWTLAPQPASVYAEQIWDIAPTDLDELTWRHGQVSQVIFVDFVAATNESSVIYARGLEDADGNFSFPLRVSQAMSEVP